MAHDYYKILGIDKKADLSEIKKAYRKLALKYHPDKTQGDKALEKKFKEMSEAYAVLSDPEKRKQYDNYGSADFQQKFSQEDILRNFNLGDILKEFGFRGGAGRGFSSTFNKRGNFSGMGGSHFFNGTGGRGCGGQGHQPVMKGKDIEYEIPLTVHEMINGTKKILTLRQNNTSKEIKIKIPGGLTRGKKVRLAGKGEANPLGGPPGDLYIKSRFVPSDGFTVDGNDISLSKQIKLSQALAGDKIRIQTPTGKKINLKIPTGTNHKTRMRLKAHGIPDMKGNSCGDLFVVVNINMPEKLTEKQKNIIEQLKKAGL